jgi:hypothetical protein
MASIEESQAPEAKAAKAAEKTQASTIDCPKATKV